MIYGTIIILTLIFFPEGLEGLPQRTRVWLSKSDRLMDESKDGSGGYKREEIILLRGSGDGS